MGFSEFNSLWRGSEWKIYVDIQKAATDNKTQSRPKSSESHHDTWKQEELWHKRMKTTAYHFIKAIPQYGHWSSWLFIEHGYTI